MKIQCPHCGVKGSADDSYNGKEVKCPKCRGVFAALATRAEVPPPYIEKPAEPESLKPPAVLEDVEEIIEQQKDVVEVAGEEESEWSDEDIADILTVEDAPESDQPQSEVSVEPDVERKDELNWTDIASEIDEEMAKGAVRSKEEEGDPASLNDFFADGAPAVDDYVSRTEGQRIAQSTEAITPVVDVAPVVVDEPPVLPANPLYAGLPEEGQAVGKKAQDEIESPPYGLDKEQCWQCGKKDSVGVPFIAKNGRLYCSDCLPVETSEVEEEADDIPPDCISEDMGQTANFQEGPSYDFTIVGLLKEAWAQTKGVKATVWAGSAVMYLTLLILIAGGTFLLPSHMNNHDGVNIIGLLGNVLYQFIINAVLVIFSAGLFLIGIRKVADEPIAWKMVFEGFSVSGKLIVVTILQTLLVFIGFLLLVLPGIYLAIGYAMTLPLIVDRKMSPWQAMETSRKAIHGKWWKVFGLYLVMGLIFMVSTLPLGLGIIWTWPMFVVLGGVVYHSLYRKGISFV